jgi:CDP-diacylglycerol--glycerol-3-phosphate 3-phosphatidyltransferase
MLKIPLNIPNILSLYRLISFPLVLYFLIAGKENSFAVFLCINLVTDILDGWIARTFNMQTEIGAKLDSIADMGTYILAILGVFVFKHAQFEPYFSSFLPFIFLFVFSHVLSLIKFKRLPSLHLYSWKIGGYIQGIFFFVLFAIDFYLAFYILMVSWGIAAFTEHIIIQLIIPKMRSNAKGLYWVLKERKMIKKA